MNPSEKLRKEYEAHSLDFDWYVTLHLRFGLVFSTPTYFIMARHVDRHAAPELIRNPEHAFTREQANAWWIHAATGNMATAWKLMPFPLDWVGFQRFDDDLHFYPLERINALTQVFSHDP